MNLKQWTQPTVKSIRNTAVTNGSSGAVYRGEFYAACTGGGATCVVPNATYATGIYDTVAFCSFGSGAASYAICS